VSADVKIKAIEQIYEAFGRGDVAAILDAITDDVDWSAETTSVAAPWYGVRHGKDAVAAFHRVRLGHGDRGIHVGLLGGQRHRRARRGPVPVRSRSTGRTIAMDLHHYFRFRDGKIAYYRGTEDTAQTEAAVRD
jgi:uncharacterized protein